MYQLFKLIVGLHKGPNRITMHICYMHVHDNKSSDNYNLNTWRPTLAVKSKSFHLNIIPKPTEYTCTCIMPMTELINKQYFYMYIIHFQLHCQLHFVTILTLPEPISKLSIQCQQLYVVYVTERDNTQHMYYILLLYRNYFNINAHWHNKRITKRVQKY